MVFKTRSLSGEWRATRPPTGHFARRCLRDGILQGCRAKELDAHLLVRRELIQQQATETLGNRFKEYDINRTAVLIGRPESQKKGAADDPIDRLFDQLRLRRLAEEQKATYIRQEEAATQLKALNEATAIAQKQAELTGTKIAIEIAKNKGEAELAEL